MSITIEAVALIDPTRDQMEETTASNIAFSCSASTPAPTDTDDLQISYSTLVYEWTFSDGGSAGGASGTHTFSGLSKGAEVTLTATVTVKCVKTTKTRDWIVDGYYTDIKDAEGNVIGQQWHDTSHWSSWTTVTADLSASESVSQDANTHPGTSTIFKSLSSNQIIETNLTSGMVSEWCAHCGEWLSWYYQADSYSDANGCKVSSGDWIKASWYNDCVSTALASSPRVKGGAEGTIIEPSYFHSLDDLVSRR